MEESIMGLIGVCGKARAGKDTLGKMLADELFDRTGSFEMPNLTQKMGFFATKYCHRFNKVVKFERNKMYMPVPHYVSNMDMSSCPINEIEYSDGTGYNQFRRLEKNK